MTISFSKSTHGEAKVFRHIIRRYHLQSYASLGKMLQKILGVAAIIVNYKWIESLLRQPRLQFGDQRAGFV